MSVPTSLKPFVRPAILGAALAAMAMPAAAEAASVTPELKAGNPNCEALGTGWSTILKDDGANGGPFSGNGWDITVTKQSAYAFDWAASKGVDAVIVKGGNDANVYKYAAAMGDTNLVAPLNENTQAPADTHELSHIEFCDGPDAPPTTDKTPDPDPKPDPKPDPQPEPQPEPQVQPQPEPQQQVLPQRFVAEQQALPASARLSAPASCVKKTFTVSVNGENMKSVTLLVNGKKVATKSGSRRVSFKVPVSSSVHKISAKVTYKSGATKSTQTLRAAALRCVQRVVRPQFTG